MRNLGSFTPETWIKEAARVQLTSSPSFGAAPALRGQTAKPPRFVSPGPRAADGAAGGARSQGGPVSPSDGASNGRISLAGAAALRSRARGAGDAHGGPGALGDLGSRPRRSSEPLAVAGTREPGAPREAGRRRGESGAVFGPRDGSDASRAGDVEDPGIPPAAQRPLRRVKGFRPTGLGPTGRNCARSPHAATHGASRLLPLASPGPTLGLRPLREPEEEDREKGRARHTRARSRGPGLRHAGARAPLQQRT